jgi:hypothetical protein
LVMAAWRNHDNLHASRYNYSHCFQLVPFVIDLTTYK